VRRGVETKTVEKKKKEKITTGRHYEKEKRKRKEPTNKPVRHFAKERDQLNQVPRRLGPKKNQKKGGRKGGEIRGRAYMRHFRKKKNKTDRNSPVQPAFVSEEGEKN